MKFLAITHQLTRTGAPVVLMSLIRLLLADGHGVEVISLEDGPLVSDFSNIGIKTSIRTSFDEGFVAEAKAFDHVICNTVETYMAVTALSGTDIPVIWWIHEPRQWFETFYDELPNPKEMGYNIHILSVSPLTQDAYREIYDFDTECFPFYVDDMAESITAVKPADRVTRFLFIGLFSYMKGPDVLAAAITNVPQKVLKNCEFIYCGDLAGSDPDFVETVNQIAGAFPMVRLQPSIPHDELLNLLSTVDYLIVPSRFDPMPTVAAEAMMLSVPVILSTGCGISRFLRGDEGFTFGAEDVGACAKTIERAVDFKRDRNAYNRMKNAARKCYEENFTKDIFLNTFYSYLKR